MRANPPVKQFRHGRIVASIWCKTQSERPTYACTFERRFLDPEDGAWRSSLSFTHLDLLALIRVALDAAAYLTVAEASKDSSTNAASLRRERTA
jgi:hypothetical protein